MLDIALVLVGLISGMAPTYILYLAGQHGYPGGDELAIAFSLAAMLAVVHCGNLAISGCLPRPVGQRSLWGLALTEAASTWFVPLIVLAFGGSLSAMLSGALALVLCLPLFIGGPIGSWWVIKRRGTKVTDQPR